MLSASHQNVCANGLLTSRLLHTRRHLPAPFGPFTTSRRQAAFEQRTLQSKPRRGNFLRAESEKQSGDGQTSTATGTEEVLGNGADATSSSANDQQQPVQEVTVAMSEEDIQALKAALQKQRSGGDQEVGLVQGILEEVRLISWPNPLQALLDTLVVIAIVTGTAVSLFLVNTILADISKQIY
ncbi:probable preprotein translocase subunit SECE1 at C-terminar half [Coccomyxa sp. Obi]|nr:probable preprotein translocase subunit SECE1 at C-terminar half [Coccomyxa sp. Obi]